MSKVIKLLVVEDDDSQFETYSDSVDELATEHIRFELTRKESAAAAKVELLSTEFDGAVVDLNLNPADPTEASGNDVLSEIIEAHRFPVFVVSGNLAHLDEEIRVRQSGFLQCFDRDTENALIFGKLRAIYETGITEILGGRGEIETRLGEIFWNHLANDMDVWTSADGQVGSALLRYTVSHLTEYLDTPTSTGSYYQEPEFYIRPPIREHIATGDIVEYEGTRFIVLSPSCDVAVRGFNAGIPLINAEMITLAKLIDFDRANLVSNNVMKENATSGERRKLAKIIISGQRDKYVYLPKYGVLNAAVADLQNLYSISFEKFLQDYTRLATISSPFLKDIQSRFSSYYGRQGQPDLDKDRLAESHRAALSPPEA